MSRCRSRIPRAPSRAAAREGEVCFGPAHRSYLNLRSGCRGRGGFDRAHRVRQDPIEKIVDLLWCATHVCGGIDLLRRGAYAQPLELRSLREPVEQILRALETLTANDFMQLLAIAARLHAAHEQALSREEGHTTYNV